MATMRRVRKLNLVADALQPGATPLQLALALAHKPRRRREHLLTTGLALYFAAQRETEGA